MGVFPCLGARQGQPRIWKDTGPAGDRGSGKLLGELEQAPGKKREVVEVRRLCSVLRTDEVTCRGGAAKILILLSCSSMLCFTHSSRPSNQDLIKEKLSIVCVLFPTAELKANSSQR